MVSMLDLDLYLLVIASDLHPLTHKRTNKRANDNGLVVVDNDEMNETVRSLVRLVRSIIALPARQLVRARGTNLGACQLPLFSLIRLDRMGCDRTFLAMQFASLVEL